MHQVTTAPPTLTRTERTSLPARLARDIRINRGVYLMFVPVLIYYLAFHYTPMYGAIIAFKSYSPARGILGSEWVGFDHFTEFFRSYYFWRVFKNTLVISVSSLLFGFPAPIMLALLINELKSKLFSRTVQTVTYMPHFISLVVICGMIVGFTMSDGIVNDIVALFGGQRVPLLSRPEYFVPIYVLSNIWQNVGWGSIIFLAAITAIDESLYQAATIDGAGRWRQAIHITLPGITPTIVILFILRMGNLMSVGFEKIILLYNPAIYSTADVISTYVYRKGLLEFDWSYSAAVGLFNQVINFALLILANRISRRVNESSLW
jgi:putative aldouronate transport system permease protein